MKLKTLLLLILEIFPIIVLANADDTLPMSAADIAYAKTKAKFKHLYENSYEPTSTIGIKPQNFKAMGESVYKASRGKEKDWWNPFDKERKPWNPLTYSNENYNDLAIQQQKEDAENFMLGVILWGGIFTIIVIIIRKIKGKNKEHSSTNQNSSNLKDYLSYDIVNLQNRENKLDEAFNNGILTPEEYKEKKEKLEEEKNILLKRQEQRKQLDALANLFHNGIITNEEYWIKKNQIINS